MAYAAVKLRSVAYVVASFGLLGLGIAALAGDRTPSFVLWMLLFLAVNMVGSLVRAVRARVRSRAHANTEDQATLAALVEGPCVLEGEVEYAEGADTAMRIEFTQLGSESESSGSWSHKWTEIERKLTVQPFYLRRRDGQRVRVEPKPQQSRLCDELENMVLVREDLAGASPGSAPQRARFATLMPRERVWVTGQLEHGFDPEQTGAAAVQAGYRQSAQPASWIVRGAPVLLVSSISLAQHFRERAARHLRHALVYALAMLAPLTMGERYLDRLFGQTVIGTVESMTIQTNESDQPTGYEATVRHAHGTSKSESILPAPAVGSSMEFRVGSHCDNPGSTARYTVDETWLNFFLALGVLVCDCVLTILITGSLPWYRSDRIKVEDSGSGRLHG